MKAYEQRIHEPRVFTAGPVDADSVWEGEEVEITVKNIPATHVWTLTVEEAYLLRDLLDKHLKETYEI